MTSEVFDFDHRQVELFTFPSGFRCYFIHDEEVHQTLCTMNVNVGQIDDFGHIPGISHLIEHCLMLASEKFPHNTGEFYRNIVQHNGYHNAFTGPMVTNYHFRVFHDYFLKALEMFLSYFEAPLFPLDHVMNEMSIVDLEHKKNIVDNERRMYEARRRSANQQSPYSKLDLGCAKCLKRPEVHSEILSFFKKHYKPHNMSLVIASPLKSSAILPLITKTTLIAGSIPSTPKALEGLEVPLFQAEDFNKFLVLKSVNDEGFLQLSWYLGHEKVTPVDIEVLTNVFLNHEAGSLKSKLLGGKLIYELKCDVLQELETHVIVDVRMALTGHGLKNISHIINLVWRYVCHLKSHPTTVKDFIRETHAIVLQNRKPLTLMKLIDYTLKFQNHNHHVHEDPFHQSIETTERKVLRFINGMALDNLHISISTPAHGAEMAVKDEHHNLQFSQLPLPAIWTQMLKKSQGAGTLLHSNFKLSHVRADEMECNSPMPKDYHNDDMCSVPKIFQDHFPMGSYHEITHPAFDKICYRLKFTFDAHTHAGKEYCPCILRRYVHWFEREVVGFLHKIIKDHIKPKLFVMCKCEMDTCSIMIDCTTPEIFGIIEQFFEYITSIAQMPFKPQAFVPNPYMQAPPPPQPQPQQNQQHGAPPPQVNPFQHLLNSLNNFFLDIDEQKCRNHNEGQVETFFLKSIQIMASGTHQLQNFWVGVKNHLSHLLPLESPLQHRNSLFQSASTMTASKSLSSTEKDFNSLVSKQYRKFQSVSPFEVHLSDKLPPGVPRDHQRHVAFVTLIPETTGFKTVACIQIIQQFLQPIIAQKLRFPVPISYVVETIMYPFPAGVALVHYVLCPDVHVAKVLQTVKEVQVQTVSDPQMREMFTSVFEQAKGNVLSEKREKFKSQVELTSFLWQCGIYGRAISDELDEVVEMTKDLEAGEVLSLMEEMFVNGRKTVSFTL